MVGAMAHLPPPPAPLARLRGAKLPTLRGFWWLESSKTPFPLEL